MGKPSFKKIKRKIKNKKSLQLPDELRVQDDTLADDENAAKYKSTFDYEGQSRKEARKAQREEKKRKRQTQQQHDSKKKRKAHADTTTSIAEHSKKQQDGKEEEETKTNNDPKKKRKKKKNQTGGAAAGAPAPAPAPWEVDPLIAREQADLQALSRKLGLQGAGKTSEKARKKLQKELAMDGFGDDFVDFLDDLDRIAEITGGGGGGGGESAHPSSTKQRKTDSEDGQETEDGEDEEEAFMKMMEARERAGLSTDDVEGLADEMLKGSPGPDKQEGGDLPTDIDSDEDNDDDDLAQFYSEGEDAPRPGETVADLEGEGEEDAKEDENEADSELNNSDQESGDEVDSDDAAAGGGDDDDGNVNNINSKDTYRPLKGQDIYGREVDASGALVKQTKYIPPHLRTKAAKGKADEEDDLDSNEDFQKLKRVVNGVLNRMTDGTLEQAAGQLRALYAAHPHAHLHRLLRRGAAALCLGTTQLRTGFAQLHAALVGALHYTVGAEAGARFLEWAALGLLAEYDAQKDAATEEMEHSKKCQNLVLLVAYLYEFQVVQSTLIYDLIQKFLDSFKALDVELLLLILQNCGYQLRSDDPTGMKEMILRVKSKSAEILNEDNVVSSARVQYMIDTIMDIKNNKQRKANAYDRERSTRLRKMIGHFKSAKGGGRGSSAPLRLTLKDLTEIDIKGRWWLVGASFIGNQMADRNQKQTASKDLHANEQTGFQSKQSAEMVEAASKQRMNTEVRKAIFFSIMSATDFEDAFEKLLKLNLKGSQEHEIIKVLVDLSAQEKTYNPFYAYLAARFCEYDAKFKFTCQLAFWDAFKQFEEGAAGGGEGGAAAAAGGMGPRRARNLGLLLAHLVGGLHLSLAVTKAADMSSLPRAGIIFFRVFFDRLFLTLDEEKFIAVFDRVAGAKDALSVKENVLIFLHEHMKTIPESWSDADKKKFKKRRKVAKGCLESMSGLDNSMA